MTPLPDFDTLRWLADHEPDRLEQLQHQLNQEAIAASDGNQEQLTCLVFNLEQQLARCDNPYHRCVVAMGMMRSKLYTLSTIINEPEEFLETAKIIPFRRPAQKPR
ncbi:DUF3135 domain-containing protein [Shewanella cyperi]|nr:DUF3135 domain-containing protein [Shewanella cyperi]QSX39484.1 DUF3135 domain-containing protein [Shewanella cyperi]